MASTFTTLSDKTNEGIKSFTYKWTITNWRSFNRNEPVYSDTFEMDHVSWKAIFQQDGPHKFCGLKFLGCPVFGTFFSMPVEFSCFAEKWTSNQRSMVETALFEPLLYNFDLKVYDKSYCRLISTNLHELEQPENTLRLIFKITTRKVGSFIIPPSQLLRDLEPNLKNRELTDVSLVISSSRSTVKAHKEILAARSPVLAAMFNTNMVEKQQNSVNIEDMSAGTLKQLVKYIYTDKTTIEEKTTESLLIAADKYDLPRLKAACEHAVFTYVSVSSAIDKLIFAEKHNAKQLKTHLLQFIATNADDVMKGDGWQTLVDNHPLLLLDVYQAMAKK